MKKNFFLKFFLFAIVASLVTFTSCKDYDDDISKLEKDITSLQSDIAKMNKTIEGGAVITDVAATDNGIKITLSDGKSYTLTNGANGTNGSVVEIGDNGNWVIDGKDTDKPSQGKDGVYYKPGEDGYWYLVDGDTKTKTDDKWLNEGTITAKWEKGSVMLYNVEGTDGPVTIGKPGVTNLTVIPDWVADKGGALPLINFSPLETECGDIAPATLVRYRVSPSNVTEAMIDKENLRFEYNNPQVRAAVGLDPKAEFVSLEDGVLTVRALINTAALPDMEKNNKIVQMMLVVPSPSGSDIASDWAKVVSEPIKKLALVRKPSIVPENVVWADYQLKETAQEAKDLAKTHVTVVDLAYNETLDLLEVVKTMQQTATWSDFNIDTYNLMYAFDLNDENGDKIVYETGGNKTDQQKFLNLVGSEVSTRVYDIDGPNPAAIDRTPIVHVMLKSKDGAVKCNVLDGFIKINIVEAKVEPVPPVTFPVTGEVEAGCDDYTLRVGTKEMNEEFYAKAKVSKEFFHANYTWSQNADGVGTITEVKDLEDTQSYNLLWTVTPDELADNVGKTIEKTGKYTYGNNVIAVKFTAKITQPSINIGELAIDNYWYDNKSFVKFNTNVPTSTTDNDPANNTFDVNINNVFKTVSRTDLRLAVPQGYKYEYFFDKKENQPVKSYNGITISVSADSKELLASKDGGAPEIVATIQPQTQQDGDILSYNEKSALAKELLNAGAEFMKARLYINVKNNCGKDVLVKGLANAKAFDIHFLRPVNIEKQSAEAFVDGVDSGKEGSFIDLKKVVRLSDWRNYAKNSDAYYFEPDNQNYYGFYDISAITVDIANIKPVGLKVNGEDLTELPGTIVIAQEGAVNPPKDFGQLTYRNNGAGLDESFILQVPVTITYKWGDVSTVVEVEVKKTAATRSIL